MVAITNFKETFSSQQGLVAQWITRLTTDQKIPGSNPGELVFLAVCCFKMTLLTTIDARMNFTILPDI